MTKNKNIRNVVILIALAVILTVGVNFIYKDHRDIKTEKPSFVIQSKSILHEFANNPLEAEKKYLNKTIQITGIISEKNNQNLALNGSIFCQFQNSINETLTINDSVTVKGRCIGYDELLEEIKLDQSTIINK